LMTVSGADRITRMSYAPDTAQEAVEGSRTSGPDHFPDRVAFMHEQVWMYPRGEYEAGALHATVEEAFATNPHVDYALNFAQPASAATFRAAVGEGEGTLSFRSTGSVSISINDIPESAMQNLPAGEIITVSLPEGPRSVQIRVNVASGTPAAIAVSPADHAATTWACRSGHEPWYEPSIRSGNLVPPHLAGEMSVVLPMQLDEEGLFFLEAPALGYVIVTSGDRPDLAVGESPEEALAAPHEQESRCTFTEIAPGTWRSSHRVGFQYAAVRNAIPPDRISVEASIRQARKRGAFLCDDDVLNRIWATSAYTVRLCMQKFMLDGIKRDRMPWIGDHALSVITNAYAFSDGEIIRNSLRALGRPRHGFVNGISDYSLWWVISHGLYQHYFRDQVFLREEAEHVDNFISDLAVHAQPNGIFRPVSGPDTFEQAGPGSVFLDWGVSIETGRDSTALQMLWYWALDSGARILQDAGHAGAARWQELATTLRSSLTELAWNESDGVWREYVDNYSPATAYANFLALLCGLAHNVESEAFTEIIRDETTGTPFMRSFALAALASSGYPDHAVDQIRVSWGSMIELGASTFWEEFPRPGESTYEMYGRPFGKSLCHAWSGGPAALLPRIILGLSPTLDGWEQFQVEPELGELGWASAVVPVSGGEIFVVADKETIRVDIPAGHSLSREGSLYEGPQTISWSYS
jgi:alpha-L-rhamnosidase